MKIITFIIITLLFMACSNQSYSPYTYTNKGAFIHLLKKLSSEKYFYLEAI
jgi:hypothetical protein